jgi:NAD(P)-dependent dehydrogenase (short-subunit alcohol dehydrogenase family)
MPKTVLISGASRGIGLLTAIEFARRGHRVLAGVRSPNTPALDAACASARVKIERVTVDVLAPRSIEQAVAGAGAIDVLVNNAGTTRSGFFEMMTPAEFDLVFETNFRGAVSMTRAVLPQMRQRGDGHIINISSIYGFTGVATATPYAASKWALEGFSESLRYEMAPFGVKVVLIEPGFFATELLDPQNGQTERSGDSTSPYYQAQQGLLREYNANIRPKAGDPAVVARKVCDVAEHPRPKLRYVVGQDGRTLRAMRSLLPASLFEGIFIGMVRKARASTP